MKIIIANESDMTIVIIQSGAADFFTVVGACLLFMIKKIKKVDSKSQVFSITKSKIKKMIGSLAFKKVFDFII